MNGCWQCHGSTLAFLKNADGSVQKSAARRARPRPGDVAEHRHRPREPRRDARHLLRLPQPARLLEGDGAAARGLRQVPSRARPPAGRDLRREQARHRLPDAEGRDEPRTPRRGSSARDYTAAPTCATCHMSATAKLPVTHDVGARISWTLRPVISKKQENWEKKRADMKDVCTTCHGGAFVDSFYKSYDDTIDLWNTKFAQPAQNVMTALREAGKLTPTPFDEEIEWTFYRLWHHEGRRARMGAAMQGPDFVQWHGFFEVAENFYTKFLPAGEGGGPRRREGAGRDQGRRGRPAARLAEGALARGAQEDRRVLQGALREVTGRSLSVPAGVISSGMKSGYLPPLDRGPQEAAHGRRAARGPEGAPSEEPRAAFRGRPPPARLLRGRASRLGWHFESLWVRVPCALVLGFVIFDGTVLLHEVVHKAVFDGDRPRAYRAPRPRLRASLRHLADAVHALAPRPPRRARLDDGRPEARAPLAEEERALAEASLRDARALPDLLPRRAEGDRDVPRDAPAEDPRRAPRGHRPAPRWRPRRSAFSAGPRASCGSTPCPFSSSSLPRSPSTASASITTSCPREPAKWGTRMARSPFWEFVYLWSNLHLEHHYFPAVPFYRLPALSAALEPFFAEEGIPARTLPRAPQGMDRREPRAALGLARASPGPGAPAATRPRTPPRPAFSGNLRAMATEIAPPQADKYEGLSREDLLRAYRNMVTSRRIDDKEIQLKRQNRIFFQISGAGHEAVQTAIALHMRKGVGLALPVLPRPRALPRPRRDAPGHVPAGRRRRGRPGVRGAADALALGRRRAAHLHDLLADEHRVPARRRRGRGRPVSPARGGRRGLAGAIARAAADEVVVVTIGEGSTSEGEFWEALNSASTLKLPVVFVVEDNGYAISVPVEVQHARRLHLEARAVVSRPLRRRDGRLRLSRLVRRAAVRVRLRARDGRGRPSSTRTSSAPTRTPSPTTRSSTGPRRSARRTPSATRSSCSRPFSSRRGPRDGRGPREAARGGGAPR